MLLFYIPCRENTHRIDHAGDGRHDSWVATSGAEFLDVSSYCKGTGNIVFKQRKLKAYKPGERILETRDLDTRNGL